MDNATGLWRHLKQAIRVCKAWIMFTLDAFTANVISLVMVGVAVIAVFDYIPYISELAFWIVLGAYGILWAYSPASK